MYFKKTFSNYLEIITVALLSIVVVVLLKADFTIAAPSCEDTDADTICDGCCDNCVGSGSLGLSSFEQEDLYDGSSYNSGYGFRYDAEGGGYLNDGSNDAYDGMYYLEISGEQYNGNFAAFEENDREFVFDQETISNLNVSRKLIVPTTTNGFGRYLEIINNPTEEPVTINVRVYGNLGSDGGTKLIRTSNGDRILTTEDYWLSTDDSRDGGYDPSLGHLWDGNGGSDRIDSVELSGDDLEYYWNNVTINPGETKIYMHFAIQRNTRDEVLAKLFKLSNNVDSLPITVGMTNEEISAVQNWNLRSTSNADQTDSDGDGVGDVCDKCSGYNDALDSDGDGLPDGCDTIVGYYDFPDDTHSMLPAVLLTDLNTGEENSDPYNFVVFEGYLYFVAENETYGRELWKTDGTASGTVLVKDINPGDSGSCFSDDLMVFNGVLYFTANDGTHGRELWKSDGTEEGTVMVKDINLSGGSCIDHITAGNGYLYFEARDDSNGYELWKSDGTEEGTVMVKDIYSDGDSYPDYLVWHNGYLYFSAQNSAYGRELWKSDGTEEGTVVVKDIYVGSNDSSAQYLTVYNSEIYFFASDEVYGQELWKTDGTEEGTVMVKDINPGSDGSCFSDDLIVFNGVLYFTANDGTHGRELWKTDGTEVGTVMVKEINPDSGACIDYFTVHNSTLYFVAYNEVYGTELWKTDGTEEGTVLVKDINPEDNSSEPEYLTSIDGYLYFAAQDNTYGREIWRTDGTEAGTVKVADIAEGTENSDPRYFTEFNNTVYFKAANETYGEEIFYLNEETYFELKYNADRGGSISGSSTQSIASGGNGTAVTAVANSGYRFLRWSDGSTVNPRTDTNITENIAISASFQKINSGSGVVNLPSGSGSGSRNTGSVGVTIGSTQDAGEITDTGVNILTYATNRNNFFAPESGNGWSFGSHSFIITNLDLFNLLATLEFRSEPVKITLAKGETKPVDLDKDGKNDISATFVGVYVNRAEITVKSLAKADDIKTVVVNTDNTIKTSPVKYQFKRDLKLGVRGEDVKELQKFLNANGFVIDSKGVGSPGKESTYFGSLTQKALIKFQKANKISPSIGYFGKITRGVANK
ncbi:MAG TPA: peptidoglycan-binding protein [Candidatus Magasanikbacteria bacterium]|nr:peptidoglycan-binding protein [Candidatus Magasanikbacteria bacterium]